MGQAGDDTSLLEIGLVWATSANTLLSMSKGAIEPVGESLEAIYHAESGRILMSKHPGVKAGPFEIRPAADLGEMIRESEQRRAGGKTKSKQR